MRSDGATTAGHHPDGPAHLGPVDPDRVRGAFLGLAVGDAVGLTVEFKPPGTFEPLTDLVGGGPFGLPAGAWTDDTSMAACLAESLIEAGGFDPEDQLRRYLRWYREGHWSSTGHCFDIGSTTRDALERFEATGDPATSGARHERSAANGSLMRLAPAPLAFAGNPQEAVRLAGESSRTTHALPVCVDACRCLGGLLVGAVRGVPRDELLSPRFAPAQGAREPESTEPHHDPEPRHHDPAAWEAAPLHPEVDAVAAGSWQRKAPPAIRGSGHVVAALEAALWAFATTDDYPACVLAAANLGDDADTTAAIAGQLAGAAYGLAGIPPRWLAKLALRAELETLADGLVRLATR